MNRRQWLTRGTALLGLGTGLISGCGSGGGNAAQTVRDLFEAPPLRAATGQPNALSVSVDVGAPGTPVNRQVLGQNLQWVDRGDEMFDATARPRSAMVSLAQRTGTTVLRYPGGLQSDTHHWTRGMGLLTERGLNEHANARSMQTTLVGTQEFLELCETLGATPLITVNLASGTADEAAAWVKQVNVDGLVSRQTGRPLPRVALWELGNEPYLQPEEQPTLWMTAAEFGRRARQFAAAMRAVDPGIGLSLPLTLDRRNGFQATPYPGFTREVLATPVAGVTHFSLHNAYVPFGMERSHSLDTLYWGAMAGGRSLQADLQGMRALLGELRPELRPQFAITEYNALFTLGRGDTDLLPRAPVGALVVADLVRVLASESDVALANFWSLSGNGFFGAIHPDARLRPSGQALALCHEVLRGQRLSATVQAPTLDTPSVGASPAVTALPLAETLVTREGNTLRLLVIHKDPANPARLSLNLEGGRALSGQVSVLSTDHIFDTRDTPDVMRREDGTWPTNGVLTLPPHSVALITLTLQNAA